MSPQSLVTPVLLVAVCLAGAVASIVMQSALWFAFASMFFVFCARELFMTVLFNRDVHRVNRNVRQAE